MAMAVALDTEDDKQDPCNELENTADGEKSNSAVVFAHVGADAGVVRIVGAVVGATAAVTVGAVVVGVGYPRAYESTANDEADDGADEKSDGPPFVQTRGPRRSLG